MKKTLLSLSVMVALSMSSMSSMAMAQDFTAYCPQPNKGASTFTYLPVLYSSGLILSKGSQTLNGVSFVSSTAKAPAALMPTPTKTPDYKFRNPGIGYSHFSQVPTQQKGLLHCYYFYNSNTVSNVALILSAPVKLVNGILQPLN